MTEINIVVFEPDSEMDIQSRIVYFDNLYPKESKILNGN